MATGGETIVRLRKSFFFLGVSFKSLRSVCKNTFIFTGGSLKWSKFSQADHLRGPSGKTGPLTKKKNLICFLSQQPPTYPPILILSPLLSCDFKNSDEWSLLGGGATRDSPQRRRRARRGGASGGKRRRRQLSNSVRSGGSNDSSVRREEEPTATTLPPSLPPRYGGGGHRRRRRPRPFRPS